VGIDPLLRHKIWDFLRDLVKTTDTTVIISTHYIQESMLSNCVALMREGQLLIEQEPHAMIESYRADSLEEVFLILSEKQQDFDVGNKITNVNGHASAYDTHKLTKQPFDFSLKRLMALLTKNFIHQKRSKT
jgi:ABC-type multidrug transport system ATPase subunit